VGEGGKGVYGYRQAINWKGVKRHVPTSIKDINLLRARREKENEGGGWESIVGAKWEKQSKARKKAICTSMVQLKKELLLGRASRGKESTRGATGVWQRARKEGRFWTGRQRQ